MRYKDGVFRLTQTAAVVTDAKNDAYASLLSNFRVHENLLLGFLGYLTVAAFLFPLDGRQRVVVTALNAFAAGAIIILSWHGSGESSRFLAATRDWIPSLLILLAYRESGLFFTPDPTHRFDYIFIQWDDLILKSRWVVHTLTWSAPWLQRYLEFAYFLCYPIVPLGLGTLYLARQFSFRRRGTRAAVDSRRSDAPPAERRYGFAIELFWTAVLLASFTCYLLFPLVPLMPPRELFNDVPGPQVAPLLRGMNHWLLGKYSVGASLFPSAHVAATTAMALAIRRYLRRLGWLFIVIAVSIALATVYGRYHYAADALAGALVGISAFFLSRRIHLTASNEAAPTSYGS